VVDFRSESACDDPDYLHLRPDPKAEGRDKKPAGALSNRVQLPEPNTSKYELRPLKVRPRRGRTLEIRESVERALLEALDDGTLSLEELASETEEALAARWNVSRTPAREARKAVLAHKDPNLDAAMRAFEQHARDGAINVYQTAQSGDRWAAPRGLWRPGSLKRWVGGLAVDGGPFAWSKIYPNLEIRLDDAERQYPGFDRGTVGRKRPAAPVRPRRGPRPKKSKAVEDAMHEQIEQGTLTIQALSERKEEALAAEYDCSRTTARRARNSILTRIRSIPE
jgi:hypothetical protein